MRDFRAAIPGVERVGDSRFTPLQGYRRIAGTSESPLRMAVGFGTVCSGRPLVPLGCVTSLIRNSASLGPYSRNMRRALWLS